MSENEKRFGDGAAYEIYMGEWSRLAGDVFLDWLAPLPGLRWGDIGCGNGASTALLLERCAPAFVEAIDPSEGQLSYARERLSGRPARFTRGSAAALPYADGSLDAAVMALVIFFVPEPEKGVAEMARVVAPGGMVSAYVWDVPNMGFPVAPLVAEMAADGLVWPAPPSAEASRRDVLHALWEGAGLAAVETRVIKVARRFADIEEYWSVATAMSTIAALLKDLSPEGVTALKARVLRRLEVDGEGRIIARATANAVRGIRR